MRPSRRAYGLLIALAAVTLSACASSNTSFESSWKSPDAGLRGRGYWGRGWGTASVTLGPTNTIVSVETLVYSLKQNKLLWSGRSKTTNPENVEKMVQELSAATAKELKKQRLIAG
jgi:hypothetical protein